MRKIILASESPWRRKILKDAGISFTVEKSGYKENMNLKLSPPALARKLALGKALAVASRHQNAIVIGADTFVVFNGKILGKPKTRVRASAMLKSLSGTTHSLLTGFAIVDSKTGRHITRVVTTKVTFRKLSSREIREYVQSGESLNAAGGYAIQGGGSELIKGIKGDYDNVAGLPLKELIIELNKFSHS
ncbi:MAG: Maf family protein [bacterium]|nr:Maf family protein [bacterium]